MWHGREDSQYKHDIKRKKKKKIRKHGHRIFHIPYIPSSVGCELVVAGHAKLHKGRSSDGEVQIRQTEPSGLRAAGWQVGRPGERSSRLELGLEPILNYRKAQTKSPGGSLPLATDELQTKVYSKAPVVQSQIVKIRCLRLLFTRTWSCPHQALTVKSRCFVCSHRLWQTPGT